MRKILLAGVGPTPILNPKKLYAPGLRLWIFAETLASHGHRVLVVESGFEGGGNEASSTPEWKSYSDRIAFMPAPREPMSAAALIRTIAERDKPDCVVSTTDVMNNAVARAGLRIPKWFDFNGHPMAERQMQAAVYASDAGIVDQWNMIVPVLLCGDHFSTCSEPQKYALIGELGVCGRLNRLTAGHDLVATLPPGSVYKDDFRQTAPAFRGRALSAGQAGVRAEDFAVLWNGGYNTWVDVETLFRGVEYAMSRNGSVHYVSTGGAIAGHDERTFEEFKVLVAASPHRDRYHFFGWVETDALPNFYLEADCALNVDRVCYEALLGCRNRLFAWIHAELPILTTALSEITRVLEARGMVTTFRAGDANELGELILRVAQDRAPYKEKARQAKRFMREEYTNEKLLAPLLRWVENPTRAPDLETGEHSSRPLNTLAELQARLIDSADTLASREREIQQLKADLNRIRRNPLYRIYKLLRP
jgi:glycosyltransferase involved in cell wall biosynthesis